MNDYEHLNEDDLLNFELVLKESEEEKAMWDKIKEGLQGSLSKECVNEGVLAVKTYGKVCRKNGFLEGFEAGLKFASEND